MFVCFALESYKFRVTVRNFTFQFWSGTLIIYVMSTFLDFCKIFQLLCTEVSNTVFTLKATQMENTEAWVDPRIVHLAFKKAKHQNTCMLDICLESIYAVGGKISPCWYFNKHAQLNKTAGQTLCIFTMSYQCLLLLWSLNFVLQQKDTAQQGQPCVEARTGMMCCKITGLCAIPGFYRHKIRSDTIRFLQNSDQNPSLTAESICLQDLFMNIWVAKTATCM